MTMSRPESHFYLDKYERDLNFKKHYLEETAFGIARMRGITIDEAKNLIKNKIANDKRVIDPKVNYLGKNEFGDRIKCTSTIDEYLKYVSRENKILTATMVAIDNHKENPGVIPRIIKERKAQRKIAKTEMFICRDKGDRVGADLNGARQNNLKRSLNAISGAEYSPYNIFHLSSAHPILTSTGRVATSTANSSNERFLAGNRAYYTVDHVLDDICHTCHKSDVELVEKVVSKYHLHIPSVDEVMKMIEHSTVYYWESEVYMNKVRKLVSGLTDIERVIVMYNGDFYHLAIYNKEFVSSFFEAVINIDNDKLPEGKEPMKHGKDDAVELFAKSTMIDTLRNIDFTVIKTEHPELFQKLCNTYHVIDNMMHDYKDFIRAFWVTKVLPRDIGHFPTSYRKVGLLSDTDSTVFTTQFYLEWYLGKDFKYDNKVWSITSLLTYLISSIIQHYLAQISTNIGADEEHRYILSMKSEFLFGLLGLTGRGKHYYSVALLQEGKVPKEGTQWEIKGSALIASKVSAKVTDRAHQMLKDVIRKKMNNEPVYVEDVIKDVTALENEIEQSILSGSVDYLKIENVRDKSAYKLPNPPQYFNYEFWQAVYSETYGTIEHLPYDGVRLTLTTNTKSKLNAWIEDIADPVIKERIIDIFKQKGKDKFTSIVLPLNIISSTGIPKELHPIMNTKLMVSTLVASYYLLLDSFGLYISRNNNGKNIITIRDRLAKSPEDFDGSSKSIYDIYD